MAEEPAAYEYSAGHLSVVGHDLTEIPANLYELYPDTKQLDLSYNCLAKVTHIDEFKNLEYLVIDNNVLQSEQAFPLLDNVHTLCVNNNEIDSLEVFLDSIQKAFPNLAYLSMLKNPACPNFFMGKQDEDYARYRCTVLHKLPRLKFLDSSQITTKERKEAERVGHLLKVARPDPEQYKRTAKEQPKFKELPPSTKKVGETKASMGVTRFVYQGRQSEGNRFISNSDL